MEYENGQNAIDDDQTSLESIEERALSPEIDHELLKHVPTTITVSQGRVSRFQNSFKTMRPDLNIDFATFMELYVGKIEEKARRKTSTWS